MAQIAKNLFAMWETWCQSLMWKDPLEEGMPTHSSILAREFPGTEEPIGSQRRWTQRHSTHIYIQKYFLNLMESPSEFN